MADEEGEVKKKGFLKWIILAVLLLLLAGGGYFAYLKFFAAPPAPPAEAGTEGAPAAAPEKPAAPAGDHGAKPAGDHGGKGGKGDAKGAEGLVAIPPFVVNLADAQGRRYLKLALDVEIKGPAEDVEKNMAKIRDGILLLLSAKTSQDLTTLEGKITLRGEIAERINQALGKPVVSRVYFTDFVIQ